MNPGVVLLLLLGGFLIMDAVSESRLSRAEKTRSKKKVKYVPLSIYDEQLSGLTLRDKFSDMFYSSGPWQFRDDAFGSKVVAEAVSSVPDVLNDRVKTSDSAAAETRRVEARVQAQLAAMDVDARRPSPVAATEAFLAPPPVDALGRIEARKAKRCANKNKVT